MEMKVIHLLNWKLETIEKELENIKKQGFDAIQINPMQPFKMEKEFRWWSSYQPLGFRIGNMFGSKEAPQSFYRFHRCARLEMRCPRPSLLLDNRPIQQPDLV